MSKQERKLRNAGFFITYAFGVGLIVLGIAAMLVGIFLLQAYSDVVWLATFAKGLVWVMGLLPILVGSGIFLFGWIKSKKSGKVWKEKEVLEVAASANGVLTPGKLAIAMNVSPEEADRLLFDMKIRGVADLKANSEGAVEYVFYDLVPSKQVEKSIQKPH